MNPMQWSAWGLGLAAVGAVLCATPSCGGAGTGCSADSDCTAGTICVDGSCKARTEGDTSCATDADCGDGQVCDQTAHQCSQGTGGLSCTASTQCPDDQFCNTTSYTCSPLAAGFCKKATQCSGATRICSAPPNGVGRCVECM